MKKQLSLVLVATAIVAMTGGIASATTFMSDTFSYADGELTSNDGTGDNVSGGAWRSHSGETFDDNIDVISGQAELLNSGSEDAHRDAVFGGLQQIGAGETWYYAALVTVNDRRADPNNESLNNDYFIHFMDNGFGFRTRTWIDDPNVADPTKFTFGLSATSGSQAAKWATDLDFGQEYKIVGSYAVSTGETNLWVDPVDSSSTKITHTDGAAALTLIQALGLRQDFVGGTPNNQILVNSVALGNDFDSVLMNAMNGSNIPEPTSLAMAFLALVGIVGSRRSL
ncbi:PEP-CTERM sorting domain-containing protein [Bythopirellula goksoeyrii]|uniref:Ice-binding protein C-terminal domain-containing protein n=1 Tax=Bythopirellula goksoeyrii TaxID=1400387 RepID=A0A5B9Q9F9_9BACT|nr:PEP-CTERM sorting domain-containing protein [Bythopirellula goksoeyrii]QEG34032.1 hypothetical protein Pr1d_13040 [Bythopirellula goksoeyrii]